MKSILLATIVYILICGCNHREIEPDLDLKRIKFKINTAIHDTTLRVDYVEDEINHFTYLNEAYNVIYKNNDIHKIEWIPNTDIQYTITSNEYYFHYFENRIDSIVQYEQYYKSPGSNGPEQIRKYLYRYVYENNKVIQIIKKVVNNIHVPNSSQFFVIWNYRYDGNNISQIEQRGGNSLDQTSFNNLITYEFDEYPNAQASLKALNVFFLRTKTSLPLNQNNIVYCKDSTGLDKTLYHAKLEYEYDDQFYPTSITYNHFPFQDEGNAIATIIYE